MTAKTGEPVEIPIKVTYNSNEMLNEQLQLRFIPIFTQGEFACEPMKRCTKHWLVDKNPNWMWCNYENGQVEYNGFPGEIKYGARLSVVVPMPKNIQAVEEFVDVGFRCFNSCFGTQERKTAIIITLENVQTMEILAQDFINVKVSADILHDKKKIQKSVNNQSTKSSQDDAQSSNSKNNRKKKTRPSKIFI